MSSHRLSAAPAALALAVSECAMALPSAAIRSAATPSLAERLDWNAPIKFTSLSEDVMATGNRVAAFGVIQSIRVHASWLMYLGNLEIDRISDVA